MTRAGLPHSETPGSTLPCQLPREYRRLERPSSALDAKASTMCPYQLAKQTHNTTNKHTHPTTSKPVNQAGASAIILRAQTHELSIKTQNYYNHCELSHYKHPHQVHIVHRVSACSRPLSKNQTTRSPTSTQQPLTGHRRLMPQTPNSMSCTPPHKEAGTIDKACLRPLVNTPNRTPTFGECHGVCSLERR